MTRICYVTAFLDIGRDSWPHFTRTTRDYLDSFKPYLDLFSDCDRTKHRMIVYMDTRYYTEFVAEIGSDLPIEVIPIDEAWLTENSVLWDRLSREQEILDSFSYKLLVRNRNSCPETRYGKYTLINHAKIDFVVDAIKRDPESQYFCWVDFGYFMDKGRIPDKLLDLRKLDLNRVNYSILNPFRDQDRDMYYTVAFAPEIFGGFFFFGSRSILLEFQALYHTTHEFWQSKGVCDDDQGLLTQIYTISPDIFSLHNLGGWHRALKYFQLSTNKFSIVLPIKVNSGNSYQLFCDLALHTYEKYLSIQDVYQFYIITPSSDIPYISRFTNGSKIPFRIIPEESLNLPESSGWFKQQLIKLKISSLIETDYYLVVDADMYLIQPLGFNDIFYDGKIKYNYEEWQTINNSDYSQNSNWWENSCKFIGYDSSGLHTQADLMSVTPQVLVTDIVRNMIANFISKHGELWETLFCDMRCTEFTLYWLYILKYEPIQKGKYTTLGFPLWKHTRTHNILDYHNLENSIQTIRNSFITPTSHFGVIQGYLTINVTELIQEGMRCLARPEIDAVIITAAMLTPNRFQRFTIEERHSQSMDTIYSARKYIPNSICIFIDGSNIVGTKYSQDYIDTYDHTIFPYGDLETDKSVNHPTNIGFGECKLLHTAALYVRENILPYYAPKFIVKLGGRYTLTEKFDFNRFVLGKCNFMQRWDESIQDSVFVSKLYSIPPRYFRLWENILLTTPENLGTKYGMVESMYKQEFPAEIVNILIPPIGISGKLSYTGEYFHD